MISQEEQYESILSCLKEKTTHKVATLKEVKERFKILKDEANNLIRELSDEIKDFKTISITYTAKGEFEAEIRFGEDVLVLFLHNDIFDFDKSHSIWKRSYVKENPMRAYCGMISVFNFLKTSFEMDRSEDVGYLIGRIFINRDTHFFVEGKKQLGFLYNDFGNAEIDRIAMRSIIMSAIQYCQEFDLQTPPFNSMSEVPVGAMIDISTRTRVKTGKRLGFQFSWDKDSPE